MRGSSTSRYGPVRRVSRKAGQVWVPKAGWIRFRWSRAVPPGAKSYRVTMDRAGRWHVAFRSEEHTSELQSLRHLVCRLLLEKKKTEDSYTTAGNVDHQSVTRRTPTHRQ